MLDDLFGVAYAVYLDVQSLASCRQFVFFVQKSVVSIVLLRRCV